VHSGLGESQGVRPSHSRVGNPRNAQRGSEVIVVGYQMPGGRITARYVTTGRELALAPIVPGGKVRE
jgi:hypothetical protein